jgi:1-acyl-sn-glycerol-3-phosphate acyltransferase
MIASHRWPWFARWFGRRVAARIRGAFAEVRVHGLEEIRGTARAHPTLWVTNHSSWWDPLVAVLIGSHELGLETFAMMASENLERLRFFSLVGAFGVSRDRRRDGAAATHYAASLLDRPGRSLWIYPQGETCAPMQPLRFHGGAVSIQARAPGCLVVPVGVRYEHGDDPRPTIWVAIGAPLERVPAGREGTHLLEREVERCLANIDARAVPFSPLFARERRGDDLSTRLLSTFARVSIALLGRRLQAAIATQAQGVLRPSDAASRAGAQQRHQ